MHSTRFSRAVEGVAAAARRRPRTTIALWLAFVVACLMSGSFAATQMLEGADAEVGPTAKAEHALEDAGLTTAPTETVLVTGKGAADLAARLKRADGVASVASQQVKGATLVTATLRGTVDDDRAEDRVDAVRRAVAATHRAHPGSDFQQTGAGSFDQAIGDVVADDLGKAEMISVPITLIVLLLAFGAFVAASVPLLLGLTSVAAAIGAGGLVSQLAPASESASSLVVLIGLAVGVDYSLFYIRREREERRKGLSADAALAAASAGVARAIVVSGLTVVVAISGLLLTGMPMFASMALNTMLVVVIAVLGSLTVLPATLQLLGDRIGKGRIPLVGRLALRQPRFWPAFARGVTRHPVVALGTAAVILGALIVPATTLRTHESSIEGLPQSLPVVQAQRDIERIAGRTPDPAVLVVRGEGLEQADLARYGRAVTRTIGADGPVDVRISQDRRTAAVEIPMPAGDDDTTVHMLRREVLPQAAAQVPGAHDALLGGEDAGSLDFTDRLQTATPIVVGLVLLLAFFLLLATFRSARLAAAVVGLNLASVGAAYGVLAAVFQHDWATGLLDFTNTGTVIDWVPLFSFVILFGLSMDYTIIVLERVREAQSRGLSIRDAAADGVAATAGAVTSAAAVMIAVFAIFGMLRLPEMKQLGVGLAAAVLIDATVVRALALPAVVTLVGGGRRSPRRRQAGASAAYPAAHATAGPPRP